MPSDTVKSRMSSSKGTGENFRDSQSSRYRETDLKQTFCLCDLTGVDTWK